MEYVILSNGVKMPRIGYGTYKVPDKETILEAIKVGYRLIDTAQVYQTEINVGNAIKESGIPREEFFIVTKLRFRNHEDPIPLLEESFKKLQTNYIDLVLIHWPDGNYYHAYKVLEKYYKEGRIKAIGVSNFDPGRLIDLWQNAEIKPMVDQIEANVYAQRFKEFDCFEKYNVRTMAYAPLGHGSMPEILEEPLIKSLAEKYHKSPAQICLKYLYQRGFVIIPKSSNPKRIKENFEIFDFILSDEDMEEIKKIDKKSPCLGKAESMEIAEKMYAKIE